MPYKDIEKRKEGYRRWYKNNKELVSKRWRIYRLARKFYPISQKCSIKNCTTIGERHHDDYNNSKIRWLCKKHHEAFHHENNKKLCLIKKCKRKHHARGFCKMHYKRIRRIIKNGFECEVK